MLTVRFYFLLLIAFISLQFLMPSAIVYAQYENVWAFGNYAGLDFNSGQPTPIRTAIAGMGEANASVCDANGRLLFYTEGTIVWDKNGNVMANGNNLVPLASTNENTTTSSTAQGALIVPIPKSSKHYVFSLTSIEQLHNAGRLYYSVVDMNLNGGLGDIVAGQSAILLDSTLGGECMTAVTGNNCNNWLLVRSGVNNKIKAYDISESGIDPIPRQSEGGSLYGRGYGGQMVIAPGGNKLVSCNSFALAGTGNIELYDFDRAAGTVSNLSVLDNSSGYYGAAFSRDNSKLYATNSGGALYQFDLTAVDPASTKTLIGPRGSGFSQLKLAPDGKIYSISHDRIHLSSIHHPEMSGLACEFTPDAIKLLGSFAFAGLPNAVAVVVPDTALPANTVLQTPCWFNESNSETVYIDSAAWNIVWNDGSTIPAKNISLPGTYYVTYTTSPCTYHSDTFVVVSSKGVLPHIDAAPSCYNSANGKAWAYTYPDDAVAYLYTWMNDAGAVLSNSDTLQNVPSGNYLLQINTVYCDTVLPLFIRETDYRVGFFADSIICQGNEVSFRNKSDAYFTSFAWNFGDGFTDTIKDPVHNYRQDGSYKVLLAGIGENCNDTSYKKIEVDPRTDIWFIQDRDSICTGEYITFHPLADSTIVQLQWSFGDGIFTSSSFTQGIRYSYEVSGTIQVKLQAQFRACPDTAFTDTVHVYPFPNIILGADTSLCLNGRPLILRSLQASSSDLSYRWNTGDTTESLIVKHPGVYSLTGVSELAACSSVDTIEIIKDCYIDVPNSFTPNNDGINDYFFPRQLLSSQIYSFRMKVFSRWGQLVFETNISNGSGWDGRFNGKEQMEGTYIYMIKALFADGRDEHYEGNVTLLR